MPASVYEISHWNASLFFDAPGTTTDITANLKGIITGLTLPTLERDFDTTKRAGELGAVARPKTFNEVETSFTVKNLFREFLEALSRGVVNTIQLKATTCIQADDGTVTPYVVTVKGFVSSLPFGDLSDDGLETEVSMMCHYVEVVYSTFALIYDPKNYIYSINGVNLFENVKTVIDPVT